MYYGRPTQTEVIDQSGAGTRTIPSARYVDRQQRLNAGAYTMCQCMCIRCIQLRHSLTKHTD